MGVVTGRTQSSTSLVLSNAAVVEVTEACELTKTRLMYRDVLLSSCVQERGESCVKTLRRAQQKCRKENKQQTMQRTDDMSMCRLLHCQHCVPCVAEVQEEQRSAS